MPDDGEHRTGAGLGPATAALRAQGASFFTGELHRSAWSPPAVFTGELHRIPALSEDLQQPSKATRAVWSRSS